MVSCLHVCVCALCMQYPQKSKESIRSLELEMIVSHCVGVTNWNWVFHRRNKCWANSPPPVLVFILKQWLKKISQVWVLNTQTKFVIVFYFLLEYILYFALYMCVQLCGALYLWVQCPWKPEEGIISLRADVTDSWEPPGWVWELQEHRAF